MQKKLKTKQTLDKLSSFCSNIITKIQILVGAYYAFCKYLDILDYVAKLLKKDKFFYNNIKIVSNKRHHYKDFAYKLTNYIYVQRQFLALIIINAIVIIFYNAIQNSKLSFNVIKINFFSFFYFKTLVFLFVIIYYAISKYQDSKKIIIPFDRKIMQSIYFFLN